MTLALESLYGRIGDLDSHESISTPHYPEIFGEIGRRLVEDYPAMWRRLEQAGMDNGEPPESRITLDIPDNKPITQEAVWTLKGASAPGAINMDRRTAVMDEMGIQRQLIFPLMGIVGWIMSAGGGQIGFPVSTKEDVELGKRAIDAYNKWAGKLTQKYKGRMWVVGMLQSGLPEMTPELMVEKAEELIASGCKAIQISSGEPPAGVSPGDRRLDPFYALLARKYVTLTFHPPSGMAYRKSDIWEAGVLDMRWAGVSIMHQPEENFIAMLILGGVFDRHPMLRVAVVESGAHWVGPLAERLDLGSIADTPADHSKLSMKPSGFLGRNVRVSTMVKEPVEVWFQRWPHLQDVYCYSSDYPHAEGGKWSLNRLFERVAPLGDNIVEKFFVNNSQFVLPAAA